MARNAQVTVQSSGRGPKGDPGEPGKPGAPGADSTVPGPPGPIGSMPSNVMTPFMPPWSCSGNGTTDDLTKLKAFNDWFFAQPAGSVVGDFGGTFGCAGTFTMGPSTLPADLSKNYLVRGDLRINQLTPGTFETVVINHRWNGITWHGSLEAVGAEGSAEFHWANRSCAIGITIKGWSAFRPTGHMKAYGFWFWGIFYYSSGGGNNDDSTYGLVDVAYNGSGITTAGYSLTANWSNIVRSGLSRNINQRDKMTVDVLPPTAMTTYASVGNQPFFARIDGTWYEITAADWVAKTITVYPSLKASTMAGPGNGTLTYAFGGGIRMEGSDSNCCFFAHIHALVNGIGMADAALYGSAAASSNLSNNGIGLVLGSGHGNAHLGSSFTYPYMEANDADVILLANNDSTLDNYIRGSPTLSLAKVFYIAPRDWATDNLTNGLAGTSGKVQEQLTFDIGGIRHRAVKPPDGDAGLVNMTFVGHRKPPEREIWFVNSANITLGTQGEQFRRLFGYRWGTWLFLGSGTNGAPAGPYVFTPPAGGTINGGAVNATVTFSGPFTGPVELVMGFTDYNVLTWHVRKISG